MDDFEKADAEIGRLLAAESFDFESPRPRLAWEAFKRFVGNPLAGLTTHAAFFECEHVPDRDLTMWMQFGRQVSNSDGAIGVACGCCFSCDVPVSLFGVNFSDWWWPEHGMFEAWCRQLEARVEFVALTAPREWQWQGYRL